jgi:hypothetical protein
MFSTHVVFLLLVILYISVYYICPLPPVEAWKLAPHTPLTFRKKGKKKKKLDLTTTHPLSRLIPCEMPRSYKRQPRRRRRQKQLCHQKERRTSSLTRSFFRSFVRSFYLARMPSHRVEPHAVKWRGARIVKRMNFSWQWDRDRYRLSPPLLSSS